jgi:hypothetical protein
VPIPLQSTVSQGERTLLQSALQTMGITSYEFKTKSDEIIGDYFSTQARLNLLPKDRELMQKKKELLKLKEKGEPGEFEKKLKESGLTRQQQKNLQQKAANIKKYLFNQVRDLDVAVNVYSVATPEEKAIYGPALKKKINNLRDRDYERYKKFRHMKDEIKTDDDLWPKKEAK